MFVHYILPKTNSAIYLMVMIKYIIQYNIKLYYFGKYPKALTGEIYFLRINISDAIQYIFSILYQ